VDVTESVRGYRYVLQRYLYVAVDLGQLAVEAGPRPGGEIIGESFPYVLGGNEAAGGPDMWVSSDVMVD
jgi:hypothetical protein